MTSDEQDMSPRTSAHTSGFEGERHGVHPQNGIPGFSLHFPNELCYGYLRFEGNGNQRNFPISFKPKVAIAKFVWKMQIKTWYSIFGLDNMPLSLKNLLLKSKQVEYVCALCNLKNNHKKRLQPCEKKSL